MRVGSIPLTAAAFEAENAQLTNVEVDSYIDASGGKKVGYINYSDSSVEFDKIVVPKAGLYTVNVRYSNGTGTNASHNVTVNNERTFSLSYEPTVKWGRYQWSSFTCQLNEGVNSIKFQTGTGYAELDCIQVFCAGVDMNNQFALVNRNSNKLLEIPSASLEDNVQAAQYDWTNYNCQLWNITHKDSSYIQLQNANSGKLLEVGLASTEEGAAVVQYPASGNYCQDWMLNPSSDGYYKIINRNSQKLLEIQSNLTENGALAGQWSSTGYACQEWNLKKEGMK